MRVQIKSEKTENDFVRVRSVHLKRSLWRRDKHLKYSVLFT